MSATINKIFVLSLEESADRRNYIFDQLDKLDLSAINCGYEWFPGKRPTEEEKAQNANFFSTSSAKTYRDGELGCLLSHIAIMRLALERNYDNVMILEDDIVVLDPAFATVCNNHMKKMVELGENFDVLYLGASHKRPHVGKITDHLYRVGAAHGTFGYIVSKKFMQVLVEPYAYKYPIDKHWNHVRPSTNKICMVPHVVNIRNCVSDVTGEYTTYSKHILNSQYRFVPKK